MAGTMIEASKFSATNIFYVLLGVTFILYITQKIQAYSRMNSMTKTIPGPFGIPYLGPIHYGFLKPEGLLKFAIELGEHYGSVVKGVLAGQLYIFLSDPRDIELILSSQTHIDKSPEYNFFKPWLGNGLLISTGDKWRSHRKIIAPTFHHNVLKSFIGLFNKNSRNIVEKMETEIGKTFDVHDYMSTVTVDILIETAMGIKKTHQDNAGYDYAMAVMKMCDIIHQRMYKIWLRFEPLFKYTSYGINQKNFLNTIHSLTSRVIQEKKIAFAQNKSILSTDVLKENEEEEIKKTIEKETKGIFLKDDIDDDEGVGEKKRKAFLDLMLQLQMESKLTDEEIKEEVDTIMFEGHDTTAAASSFFLCVLGLYQDIQEKLYEEQMEIFGDSNRPCKFSDTVNMKYLERVLMETLRLYPPVPTIARKVFQDIKLVSGNYTIPAGTNVVIGTFKVHRSPEHYGPNAEVFDPDNFLPEKTQNRHYYSFIPFSAGPRSCVGRKYAMLKLKILLSTIMRNYRIYSDIPEKDFCLTADIILKRKDGFQVRIEKRQKEA